MRQALTLVFLSGLLFTVTGCGNVKNAPFPTSTVPLVSSTVETNSISTITTTSTVVISTSSPVTVPTTTTISSTSTTPVSTTKGWKVFVDEKYHFSFSYPPDLVLYPPNLALNKYTELAHFYLDDKYGNHVIYIDPGSNNFDKNHDFEESMDRLEGATFEGDDRTIVNTLIEIIVNTPLTFGYLSQWKVFNSGKLALNLETEAIFYSKSAVPAATIGKETSIITFEIQRDLVSLNLFRRIVSTFQFNQ